MPLTGHHMNGRQTSTKARFNLSQKLFWLSTLLLCRLALPLGAIPATPGQEIINTVTVTYTNANGTLQGHTSASVSVFRSGAPVLRITRLESSAPAYMGQNLIYTIEYQNIGTVTAVNALLTDHLSNFLAFNSASHQGLFIPPTASPASRRQAPLPLSADGGSVRWSLGDLPPGAGGSVTVTTRVRTPEDYPNGDPGTIAAGVTIPNLATLTADNVASIEQATTAIPVAAGIILELDKNVTQTSAAPGSLLTYTLNYRNHGNLTATGCQLADPLPTGTTFVSNSASRPVSLDGQLLLCQLPDLPPGTGGTLSFSVKLADNLPAGAILVNQASLQAAAASPVTSNPVQTTVGVTSPGLSGRVYDSVTGKYLPGINIWLLKENAALPEPGSLPRPEDKAELPSPADHPGAILLNPLPADTLGQYEWSILAAGNYRLWVDSGSSGYLYTSRNPAINGSVQPGSRGEIFTLNLASLTIDLPLDPPAAQLQISKEASRFSASIGDTVEYLLKISNSQGPVSQVEVVDTLPAGLLYLGHSTRINGIRSEDPQIAGKHDLVWNLGSLEPGDQIELRYRVQVSNATSHAEVVNAAVARGLASNGRITSTVARHELRITEGVFTSQATIIGKVFVDRNRNGIQDQDEEGAPQLTIYMEDGRWVTTDDQGKFSMPDVAPGTHVLRLDLPSQRGNAKSLPAVGRFLGSHNSQFVDVIQPGGLYKANFAISEPVPTPETTPKPNPPRPLPTAAIDAPAPPPGAAAGIPWAELMPDMTPDLAILQPADGSIAAGDQIHVMLKAPQGALVTLKVNGETVTAQQVGRILTHPAKKLVLTEFIGVALRAGHPNQLLAEMRDSFGNLRGEHRATILCPGEPARIIITSAEKDLVADGISTTLVTVTMLDKNQLPIHGSHLLTIDPADGDIIDPDTDPTAPGHQLPYQNGKCAFQLRAPRASTEVKLTVSLGILEESSTLFFTPHLRDFLFLGIGELTLGHGSGSQNGHGRLHSSNDWAKNGTYAGFRGAFFAKGKISENTLLTAAYDSHQPERDDFFRETTRDPDAEDKYPIYGDESRGGFDAQSRDKLYIRLEHGRSKLLYGDFHTGFNDTTLARYTRTFTGLKADLITDRLRVTSFIAESDQVQGVDAIAARGISGYYFLTHNQVVSGSERITLETRDRERPGQTLTREPQTRGTDYEMDYETGAVLFKSPIPSHDENMNPIYISVTYEADGDGDKQYHYGSRALVKITDCLDLGMTGIVEENPISNESLSGLDLTLRLPAHSTVKAEIAQSDSLFDANQRLTAAADQAWSVDVESKPLDNLKIHAYHRDIGEDFQNPSATDAQRGRLESSLDLQLDLDPRTTLVGQVIDSHDRFYDNRQFLAKVKLERDFTRSKIAIQLSHENSSDQPIPVTVLRPLQSLGRSSFDISEETLDDSLALTASSETRLWKNLSLTLSHKQEIVHAENSLSQIGLQLRIPGKGRLFIKEELARYTDRAETNTLFGIEADVAKNTVGFQEYRLADGMDGEALQQSIGLRNTFRLTENLSGNLSVENQRTTRGSERRNRPDAFAAATAAEYLPRDTLKLTSRLEYRDATSETSELAELGLAAKLTRELSFLSRTRYFNNDFNDLGRRTISRVLAGLAYRPISHDHINLLSKFEYKHESDSTSALGLDCDSYIASLEMIYQLNEKTQIATKYAGKLIFDYGDQNYIDLISTRLSYDLTDRVDTSVGYRILNAHTLKSISHGGFAEVGFKIIKNLWISAGYSFDAFDTDLTGTSRHGQGPYLKLRLKVDEKSLAEARGQRED